MFRGTTKSPADDKRASHDTRIYTYSVWRKWLFKCKTFKWICDPSNISIWQSDDATGFPLNLLARRGIEMNAERIDSKIAMLHACRHRKPYMGIIPLKASNAFLQAGMGWMEFVAGYHQTTRTFLSCPLSHIFLFDADPCIWYSLKVFFLVAVAVQRGNKAKHCLLYCVYAVAVVYTLIL